MKKQLQLSILLAYLGTLSTSLLVFTPATRADVCDSRYGSGGYSNKSGYANCMNNPKKWEENLRSIPEQVEKEFRSLNNNSSSYRSTPTKPTYTQPTYTRADELNARKRLGEAFLECLDKGGRIADCKGIRVLK